MKIEKYIHFDKEVSVVSEVKDRHKEICLCYQCIFFQPGEVEHCIIAQENYEMDKKYDLITPVVSCRLFKQDPEKNDWSKKLGFE